MEKEKSQPFADRKQKSKPKNGQSFTDDLRPGEEVLWMSSSVQTTIWRELIGIGRLLTGVLVLALIASVVIVGINRVTIRELALVYVNTLLCFIESARDTPALRHGEGERRVLSGRYSRQSGEAS